MTNYKRKLIKGTTKRKGRSHGRVAVRHRGGGRKKRIRLIDWKRDKWDIEGRVEAIEYDPLRSAYLALILYPDGERRYILSPKGIKVGDEVISSRQKVPLQAGNATLIGNIPVGMPVHNVELRPGKGGQIVRSAGAAATILGKEGKYVQLALPSGEVRLVPVSCLATIGQVGNEEHYLKKLTKAGQKRHRGIRPTVRGVAQHPDSHPHGGGEGRSGIGMPSPKTPWGKKALGKKTRKRKKYSDKVIIKRRRK